MGKKKAPEAERVPEAEEEWLNEPLDHPEDLPDLSDEEDWFSEAAPPTDEQLWDATAKRIAEEENRAEPGDAYETAYIRIGRNPTSKNGIYLTRLMLSLYDGSRYPYPLQPTLAGLSEETRHLAVQIIYLWVSEGPEGIVEWARALSVEFPFYEKECAQIAELYAEMDRAVLELAGEVERNTEDER